MKIESTTPQDYINQLSDERQIVLNKLIKVIGDNIPKGFENTINYNMPSWVVPHSIFPGGYHCDPKLPLPFLSVASQKNFVALYHMGVYANEDLMKWFVSEYPKHCKRKLDMGKSCIRFKKMEDIPYELIGELVSKMTVDNWIETYQKAFIK